jgi:tetratricopeptide (TPR) repeat protein
MLGYCYLDQERYDEAEGTLTQLASGDGSVRQRVSAYLGLASLYDRRGQKEKVSKCYQEAINLDESVKEILIQLERQSFWPKPVTDKEGRPARSSPSMREIEKIIAEAKRTPQ